MIIQIGGQKGGTSKSSLAINLAVWFQRQGTDVLLVDGNATQGTAARWAERREASGEYEPIQCIEKSGNIARSLQELNNRYEITIVDTGGQDSKELRSALLVADVLLTPIRPSPSDVETLGNVSELIEGAMINNESLQAKAVITFAPTHPGVTLTEEVRDLLKEQDIFDVLDTVIHMRTSYVYASTAGAGVLEMDSSAIKAKAEIEALGQELFSHGK